MTHLRAKIALTLWTLLVLSVAFVVAIFVLIDNGAIGNMPNMEQLQDPIDRYATQIYTADGKLIGTWSQKENRVHVGYDSISPYMVKALIATEDERFYEHSGVDVKALMRAIVKRGILRQKSAGGGSTITQQLAKQLYSEASTNSFERLMQKPIEWVIAVELERYFTKEEIITLYLNEFDFLHNAVGIKSAADTYFRKSPRDLTIPEAATLVGMCKNPAYFNPISHTERCKERRNVVLGQMRKAGYITEAEYNMYCNEPLDISRFHRMDHKEGMAPYLRMHLRKIMNAKKPNRSNYASWQKQQYYADSLAWENDPLYGWCNKNFKPDGSTYKLGEDGLKVYTTIDSRMQRYAEEAAMEHVAGYLQPNFNSGKKRGNNCFPYNSSIGEAQANKLLRAAMRQSERYNTMKSAGFTDSEIEKAFHTPIKMQVFTYAGAKDTTITPLDSIRYYKSFLRTGMMSIEPATGFVKAYVGGLNYEAFQYDMCMQGRRQVGSTMKPFVYSLAMEDGRRPDDMVVNAQRTYPVPGSASWTPRNGSRARYGEEVTLKWGLSQSNNWVTAEVMYSVDPTGSRLRELLWSFGIANRDIHASLSLCLGTCDITVAEMASAYTAFANEGMQAYPILVSRIEDSNGKVIANFTPRLHQVISTETSYNMIDMLRGVIDSGTGQRLRSRYGFKGEIAGKTGTTNMNADGWFIGFVPRLITACWVGGEERDIHFSSTAFGQGASMALPIWALYMQKVYRNRELGYRQDEKFGTYHDEEIEREATVIESTLPEDEEPEIDETIGD